MHRVVVLNHHKMAAAEITDQALVGIDSLEVHFDMELSSATIMSLAG